MSVENKIDVDLFKVISGAMTQSDNLEIMTDNITQLLVGALEIKGAMIFVLNSESQELEILSNFGLSMHYVHKGPVLSDKSIANTPDEKPIVIPDVNNTDLLQYPENAKEEGIGAIVSIPILFAGKNIGALRLYSSEVWNISEHDVDSLLIVAEFIGLAMTYTRVLKALKKIRYTLDDTQGLWMLE
jgi:signal transduction protein with GAF and PtsI domain